MKVSGKLFYLFYFSMYLPTSISVAAGGLRLTPYRILLIYFVLVNLPKIIQMLAFKKDSPGFYWMFFGVWVFLALAINNDVSMAIETGGIHFIELCGPFFIGAAYLKNVKRLEELVRVMFLSIIGLLSISLPETLTGFNWFRTITDAISGGRHGHIDPRMGLDRAMATFDHPILNGVVCSSVIGLTYFYRGWLMAPIPTIATLTSLSSGAIAAVMMQGLIISWEKFIKLKKRWQILTGLCIVFYYIVDAISNRSGMMAILSLITFSSNTAYNRVNIWIAGTELNVAEHPIFGIGMNEWVRPGWLGNSVDNFWLVVMMRYGLPAFFAYAAAILIIMRQVAKYKPRDKKLIAIRRGWLCGLMGLILSACTVHYWNAAYIYFNFYVGIGFAMTFILRNQIKEERVQREAAIASQESNLSRGSGAR